MRFINGNPPEGYHFFEALGRKAASGRLDGGRFSVSAL